ncbi:MAG: hypothetical protein R3B45_12950 [Bdellovibrionota bacterium]
MIANKNLKLIPITTLLIAVGCGPKPEQNTYEDESGKQSSFSPAGGQSSGLQRVSIPISVEYGAFALTGTAATNYSVTLDDDPVGDPGGASTCLSSYTATVDETNLDGLEAYKDDRDCLAKLTSITVGGVTYTSTNAGATNFTTWLANDTALFADGSANVIRVKVISQLDSPISGTEAIVYNFSEISDADSDYVYSESEVSDAHLITVESQEAPKFKVKTATFVGMDDTSGAPEFTFKMECVDDPTSATPTSVDMTSDGAWASNDRCSEVDLADIEYKLVKDTYTDVITTTDAETIFATAGGTVTQGTDQYQDVADSYEGFIITSIYGPGGLGVSGNENMILILKAGISYTYYNIDVTTITQ